MTTVRDKLIGFLAVGAALIALAVTLSAAVTQEHSCPEATPGFEAQTAICRAVNG